MKGNVVHTNLPNKYICPIQLVLYLIDLHKKKVCSLYSLQIFFVTSLYRTVLSLDGQ